MEKQIPKSSYDYEAYYCETSKSLEILFNKHKDRIGFYPYFIPQARGCIVVFAFANLEVIQARTKPRIFQGLRALTEDETRNEFRKAIGGYFSEEQILLMVNKIYEAGFQVCLKVNMTEEKT